MKQRASFVFGAALIGAMAAASLISWVLVPGDVSVPVHWNILGEPDRYGGKAEALLPLPVIGAFILLLMWGLPKLEPLRENIEASAKLWQTVMIGVLMILALLHGALILSVFGAQIPILDYATPALGLFFAALGNYLGKSRRNWFVGVRTPWTLSSDDVWEKTHRFAGRAFVAIGLIGVILPFLIGAKFAFIALVASIFLATLGTVVLSYILFRRERG